MAVTAKWFGQAIMQAFGSGVSSTNGPFTITWDAAGIFTITPA